MGQLLMADMLKNFILAVIIVAAASSIGLAVFLFVRKRKEEPFEVLEVEAASMMQGEPPPDTLTFNGESRLMQLNSSPHPPDDDMDDDVKTKKLFDDGDIGLYSYYMELQDIVNGSILKLGISGNIRMGRNPECAVVLEDDTVSGCHCEVTAGKGGLLLRDLGSVNGTFINGVRVIGSAGLTSGVILRLGKKEFIVTINNFRG